MTEVHFAMAVASERGVICSHTATAGEVSLASPTGVGVSPVGVLLDDVEAMNFDRHGEYRNRMVVDVGSVVGLAVKGDYETDQVTGAPSPGDVAYLGANGTVSPTQLTDGITAAPVVGKFRTGLNANGFALVHIDL
jgi:hypothetical protein